MTNYTVKVTDIKYDTDEENVEGLPEVLTLEINDVQDRQELEDLVSDAISDSTGFCHFGFNMEVLGNK